ncbi:MAG: hypothetical protein ACREDR_07405 [Blastocatellia bacterium]
MNNTIDSEALAAKAVERAIRLLLEFPCSERAVMVGRFIVLCAVRVFGGDLPATLLKQWTDVFLQTPPETIYSDAMLEVLILEANMTLELRELVIRAAMQDAPSQNSPNLRALRRLTYGNRSHPFNHVVQHLEEGLLRTKFPKTLH